MGDIVQQDAAAPSVAISVLGRMEVWNEGRLVDLGTPRQRAIMAALALSEGRPVAFDAIVERVWGDTAPPTAVGTMQRYVATLRQAIEPGRPVERPPSVVVTEGSGYALVVPAGARDVDRFQAAVAEARRVLACIADPLRPTAPPERSADVATTVAQLEDALALWRGEPYADLGEHDARVAAERARLHDLKEGAHELRMIALLALGRHAEVVGDLEAITSRHPLHERWWALRSVALVRCGRQAEALERLAQMRALLADELGVDPSPPLQELFSDILRQAPSLAWRATPEPASPPAAITTPPRGPQSRPPHPRWPLVGRDAELDTLTQLLDEHRTYSRSALIAGETGSGKTRLVHELVRAAHERGLAVATGRCAVGAPDLWPVDAILTALGVGGLTSSDMDGRAMDFMAWQRVAGALRHAGQTGPLLVVVEDVQWADTATLRLLEHLVADHDLGAATLVLNRRTKNGDDARLSRLAAAVARASGARVDLAPLDAPEGRQLALMANPGLADPAAIHRRGGGNPFFITSLALADGTITGGLADVVRARVGSLPPEVRVALELASAEDDAVTADLIADLAGSTQDEAAVALEVALRAGLLASSDAGPDCYRFEHEVVREVLRTDLPIRTRTRCREHAARRSEAARQPAVLAEGPEGRRPAYGDAIDRWSPIAELMSEPTPTHETQAC